MRLINNWIQRHRVSISLVKKHFQKQMKLPGLKPPVGNDLYTATLLADVIINALYYSLIGTANKKNRMLRAMVPGTTAGMGALVLTKRLGLRDASVSRSNRTKVLTAAWYLIGALTAGLTMRALKNKA